MNVAVVAHGACSALGVGTDATRVPALDERAPTAVARDPELVAGQFLRPFAARATLEVPPGADRALTLLDRAMSDCSRALDDVWPGWRALRVGAAIGTSSGGMRKFERQPDAGPPPGATYSGPLADVARPTPFEPISLVLGACSSSTLAIGLGRAWLAEDRCDLVLCGGFDAVGIFVAAGFECLRATCSGSVRPFRLARDGVALGEGAAVLALARRPPRAPRAWVTGFGASCDAAHLTAPDADGEGLTRAGRAALESAGAPEVGLVSAHATATKQNDASEAQAIARLAPDAPTFGFKGTIGHTLGAAGALETLAAIDALERGLSPASHGEGPAEPGVSVLDRSEPSMARSALKLSSAFGGSNAALVVSLDGAPAPAPVLAEVRVSRAVSVTLEDADPARLTAHTGYAADRINRADDLVRIAMASVATLEDAHGGRGAFRGAGIVVGLGLATVETNTLFLARLNALGPARAEPRRFPFTTPNACAGECAVVFGLTGPAFAVSGGPHGGIEALLVASSLVRTGVVDRVVVVAADHAGEATSRLAPATRSGAVAMLVGRDGPGKLESVTVRYETGRRMPDRLPAMHAHPGLLPFVRGAPESVVAIPWGGEASARVAWE